MDNIQTNLWDLFGPVNTPEEPEAKETSSEKKSDVSKKNHKVADTVVCCGRGFKVTMTGKATVDDCVKELVSLGYKEVVLLNNARLSKDGRTLTFDTPLSASDDSLQVFFPLIISDGLLRMELTREDFPNLDEDEISVADLITKWCSVNPTYEGCGLCYDASYGVATPVMTRVTEKVILPISVHVYGETIPIAENEFLSNTVSDKDILSSLNLLSEEAVLCSGNGGYFVAFSSKKIIHFNTDSYKIGTQTSSHVQEKYHLPFTIHLANFGVDIPVSSTDFQEKSKVNITEVMDYLKTKYKMFGASDRKVDHIYLEDKKILSVASISGKKG